MSPAVKMTHAARAAAASFTIYMFRRTQNQVGLKLSLVVAGADGGELPVLFCSIFHHFLVITNQANAV